MKLKFVAAAVIAAAGMSSAMAAADGFWYGLGALGGTYIDSNLHSEAKKYAEFYGADSVKTDEGSFAGKIIMGYQFNDYFALEGGYYYLGQTKTKVTFADDSSDKVKITGHMLGIDAVGMLPLNNVVSLFGKVGAGVAQTKTKFSYSDEDSDSKTKTRLAPKIGVGVEFDVNDYVSIRTEYEGIFKASKDSDESFDVDYHLFTVGLKYWF